MTPARPTVGAKDAVAPRAVLHPKLEQRSAHERDGAVAENKYGGGWLWGHFGCGLVIPLAVIKTKGKQRCSLSGGG